MRIMLGLVLVILPFVSVEAQTHPTLCFTQACVSVEIADTDASRIQGLMFREGLAGDSGMLFVFDDPDTYVFWMKNMRFAIDIIWLDEDKKVVDIKTYVPPCNSENCPTYVPAKKAKYVLEVEAGFAARHQIQIGDLAVFTL